MLFLNTSIPSTSKERLKKQLEARQAAAEFEKNQTEQALENLKHCEKIFSVMSEAQYQFYPNKIQAYILFENILNHALDVITKTCGQFENSLYRNIFMQKFIRHTFIALMQSLELLLPHALKITKSFDIDLAKDKKINSLRELIKKITHQEKPNQEDLFSNLGAEPKAPRAPKIKKPSDETTKPFAPTVKKSVAPKKHKSRSDKVQERAIPEDFKQQEKHEGKTRPEIQAPVPLQTPPPKNKQPVETSANLTENSKDQAEKSLPRTNPHKKSKEQKNKERQNRALEIGNKFKEEVIEKEKLEEQKLLKKQKKIHKLPSNDLVWNCVIPELKGEHALCFDMVFEKKENHLQINHDPIVNLALRIVDILDQYGYRTCGIDLYNNVIARIHFRHDSDTGDLLPSHFIDILRSCFIIFGIYPKGWKPKTEEDFNAMEKYYRRLLRPILLEI